MERIIDERGTGKTVKLIIKAKENASTIITENEEVMVKKMYELGITGVPVISYTRFLSAGFSQPQDYLIDDLEAFAQAVLTYKTGLIKNLDGYTLTKIEG